MLPVQFRRLFAMTEGQAKDFVDRLYRLFQYCCTRSCKHSFDSPVPQAFRKPVSDLDHHKCVQSVSHWDSSICFTQNRSQQYCLVQAACRQGDSGSSRKQTPRIEAAKILLMKMIINESLLEVLLEFLFHLGLLARFEIEACIESCQYLSFKEENPTYRTPAPMLRQQVFQSVAHLGSRKVTTQRTSQRSKPQSRELSFIRSTKLLRWNLTPFFIFRLLSYVHMLSLADQIPQIWTVKDVCSHDEAGQGRTESSPLILTGCFSHCFWTPAWFGNMYLSSFSSCFSSIHGIGRFDASATWPGFTLLNFCSPFLGAKDLDIDSLYMLAVAHHCSIWLRVSAHCQLLVTVEKQLKAAQSAIGS